MPSLIEILKDPNYVNANPATKEAIFNKYAPQDENYSGANEATQAAIRQRFGLGQIQPAAPVIPTTPVAESTTPAIVEPIAPVVEKTTPSAIWDVPKKVAAGFVQSTAEAPLGAEAAVRAVPRQIATGEIIEQSPWYRLFQAITGTIPTKEQQQDIVNRRASIDKAIDEYVPRIPGLKPLAEGGEKVAKNLRESLSPSGLEALRGSEIKGNIVEAVKTGDFSKLSFGDDPSLYGYALHMSDVLGSLAPVIATAVITKSPTSTGVVGGSMAAGEAVNTATEYIRSKSDIELSAASPYYKDLRSTGMSEEQARRIITDRAAEQAALLQGTVATLGGIATQKIISGALDKYITGNSISRLRSIAQGTAVGALEEGTQEFLEGIAADLGINKEVIKEIGEDSFANLILGAIGGAPVGAGRGAVAKQPKVKEEEKVVDTLITEFNQIVDNPNLSEKQKTNKLRDKFAEDFEAAFGREATDDELDQFAYEYKQRRVAEKSAQPDTTGRTEPGLQIPGEPSAEAGVAAPPTEAAAPGVGVFGVPTDRTGVGAAPEPTALEPTGIDAPTIKENPEADFTKNPVIAKKDLKTGDMDVYYIDPEENVIAISTPEAIDSYADAILETGGEFWSVPKVEETVAPTKVAPNIEEQPYLERGERRSLKLENLNEEWGRLNREREGLSVDPSLTDSMRRKLDTEYWKKMDDIGNQVTAERERLAALPTPAGGFPKQAPTIAAPAVSIPKAKRTVKAKPAIKSRKIAKMLAESARNSTHNTPIESNIESTDLHKTEETIKAKPDINKRRVSKLLGQKLYGNPEVMAPVSVKEMVQNSFDAVRALLPEGDLGATSAAITEGKVDIKVDKNKRIISVLDNGHGMDTTTLSTTFLTIAGTKKESARSAGGLGIAKMQFLFNNKAIKVITMRDDVVSVLESTGEILDEAMDNPNVAPDIQIYRGLEIPFEYATLFPDGHGTYAEVVVPENYIDETTGQEKPIPLEEYKSNYPVLSYSPLFSNIEVKFNGYELPIGKNFPYDKYTQFADVKFNWGTANIYVSKTPMSMFYDNTRILSRGLWQFNAKVGANNKLIDREFFIDVDPLKEVTPEHRAYPFALNRQNFAPSTEAGFDQIFKYLSVIYSAVDFSTEAQNFGSVQYLTKDAKGNIVESVPKVLEPPKKDTGLAALAAQISEADVIEVKEGRLYVKGREIPVITPENMKETVIDLDEFKVPQSEIDPDKIILHDNVEVPTPELGKLEYEYDNLKSSNFSDFNAYFNRKEELRLKIKEYETKGKYNSLVSLARDKFGSRFDAFAYEIGDVFKELRSLVVELMGSGYEDLAKEGIGLSFDIRYRGVSTKIPFAGMFINPAVPESQDVIKAAYGTAGTMVHELAHYKVRSHNSDFPAEMQRISYELAAAYQNGDTRIIQLLDRLVKAYKTNQDVFNFISEANRDRNAKPRGKRFQDSGSYEARDARSIRGMEGSRPATGGDTGLFGGSESGNLGIESERQRTGIFDQITPRVGLGTNPKFAPAFEEGEKKLLGMAERGIGKIQGAVLAALQNNDLTGALRAIANQTTGFYGELAARLAALDLPTTVVLNNALSVVHKQITEMTRFEQMRLFDYVQRTYPDVYEKYFKNYDREENLPKVYDGLQAIRTGYNLGPVIGEYDTVLAEFGKNIEGLTVPGAYFPYFDAITLDTTSATYDVFLHEVIHAATSTIIDADPNTLTPGQREALAALNEMFEYAKQQIPIGLYGFKNLHEFVSEIFTNRVFRERLEKIPYKSTRQPLMTRIARAIYKLFGFDNLAGNAMAQATQLFSAVRTRQPASVGPLFANKKPKKDPKMGPVTGNWRPDEDYKTTWMAEISRGLKNAPDWRQAAKKVSKALSNVRAGDLRKLVLPNLGLRHLADLTRMAFPQLMGAVRIVEQMLAYRNRLLTKAGDILREGFALQRQSPVMMKLLGRVVIESTIRGIHPEKGIATYNRNPSDPKALDPNDPLARAWTLLPLPFKNLANRMMKYYAANLDETVQIMIDRVNATAKTTSEKARLISEIQKEFGTGARIDPYFPLYRFGNYWFQVGKGAFKEFVKFESKYARDRAMRKRAEELAAKNRMDLVDSIRIGNNISELYTKGLATTEVFKRIETLVDNISASTIPDAKDEMKDALNQLLYVMLPQQSMRKMFINRNAIQGASADILRVFAQTAMHSAYQMSRFKYSDAFRTNLIGAREYVDKKYSGPKYAELGAVYKDYIAEVEARIPQIMSNEDYSIWMAASARASQATYYYMLTAPATVLANLFGFPQLVMATLGGDYGYVKAYRTATKYMRLYGQSAGERTLVPIGKKQFLQVKYPSLFESAYLTGLQRQAADVFLEERDIDISQTNDILSLGDKPSEFYTQHPERIRQFISGPLHQSERLMREIGLISAFDLAYEKFSKNPKRSAEGYILRDAAGDPIMRTPQEVFEDAIQEARDKIGISLGDFNRQMKPRTMATPGLSILMIFKTFPIYASYNILRDAWVWALGPLSKLEREHIRDTLEDLLKTDPDKDKLIEQRMNEIEEYLRVARKDNKRRLAGIFGTAMIIGGWAATPLFSFITPLIIKAASSDDDDDEFFDWEAWFHNWSVNTVGGYAASVIEDMGTDAKTAKKYGKMIGQSVERGPISAMTGVSLTDRISLDLKNLWFRDPRYSPSAREEVTETTIANAGPAVGLAVNHVDAYDLVKQGYYERAVEKILPEFAQNPLIALRYAKEGAKTKKGEILAEDFSAWELAMQAVGLQPERLAVRQKEAIKRKTYEQKVKDEKTAIMNRLWLEKDNPDAYNRTLDRVSKFNQKHPALAIKPENILESFKERSQNQAEAEQYGVLIEKKLRGEIDQKFGAPSSPKPD